MIMKQIHMAKTDKHEQREKIFTGFSCRPVYSKRMYVRGKRIESNIDENNPTKKYTEVWKHQRVTQTNKYVVP